MILKRTSTITNPKQIPAVRTCMYKTQGFFDSLKCEAKLEKLDRQSGHQYIPMDIYVDSTTIKEHFQALTICNRWARKYHPTS